MSKIFKILIVDDHELIHNGLSDFLQDASGYEIIGHAYDGVEAIAKTEELEPDIILMDISMPKKNGIDATTEILKDHPNIKIIALSQHEQKEYISRMMKAGCYGYLLKNSRKDEILRALSEVSSARKYVNSDLIDSLLTTSTDQKEEAILTKRELEILRGIAAGKNNPEIADDFSISVRTVETHRRNLMQKLKVNSVVDLLRTASHLNLIDF